MHTVCPCFFPFFLVFLVFLIFLIFLVTIPRTHAYIYKIKLTLSFNGFPFL